MSIWGITVDQALVGVMAAAALAGWVRGFSGFGAAMVFVPLASAFYSPQMAVVLLFLTDSLVSFPMLPPALVRCRWREVAPLALGATILVPVGVKFLLVADVSVMRWAISLMILIFVGLMASGWRFTKRPSLPTTFAIGALAGLAGGMTSLYGPPIVLFWLGGQQGAPTVRANILAFFGLLTVVSAATYLANGLLTLANVSMAAILMPIYALGIFLGARSFRLASDHTFRRFALALCASIAVLSLPIWQ